MVSAKVAPVTGSATTTCAEERGEIAPESVHKYSTGHGLCGMTKGLIFMIAGVVLAVITVVAVVFLLSMDGGESNSNDDNNNNFDDGGGSILIIPFAISNRTATCYSDCAYDTLSFADWEAEDFCRFRTSINCTEGGDVESYSCVPTCLEDCPGVFCDTMSALVHACDSKVVFDDHDDIDNGSYDDAIARFSALCYSTYAATVLTKTALKFSADIFFTGLTAAEFQAYKEAQLVARQTFASLMTGISVDRVNITSITDYNYTLTRSKEMIRDRRSLSAGNYGAAVRFSVRAVLEELGYTHNDGMEVYKTLFKEIADAVISGELAERLNNDSNGLLEGTNISEDIGEVDDVEVEEIYTLSPTGHPSAASPVTSATSRPVTVTTSHPTITTAAPAIVSSAVPSFTQSFEPSTVASFEPTVIPSFKTTAVPSFESSSVPSFDPTVVPSFEPTTVPSFEPTVIPSFEPSTDHSFEPTVVPSFEPTAVPSFEPTAAPSFEPTVVPSFEASEPTTAPSFEPTVVPSFEPTRVPSFDPTVVPSFEPTAVPSFEPTTAPSFEPTVVPSFEPTRVPSFDPTVVPSFEPTAVPSFEPTTAPSFEPTVVPSFELTRVPSFDPTVVPSFEPTAVPSCEPSFNPSALPTCVPTSSPTFTPVYRPDIVAPMEDFVWNSNYSNYSEYTTPSFFEVTNTETASSSRPIGPFSFTVTDTPINELLSSGFEPMSLRYRFMAEKDGLNHVHCATSLYDQYIDGVFDNGTARVYRMVNSSFTLVRSSRIKRYHSSGWFSEFTGSQNLISPSVLSMKKRFPSYYATPSVYFFKIVAVLSNGEESNSSEVKRGVDWTYTSDGSTEEYAQSSTAVSYENRAQQHAGNTVSCCIPSPTNLTVEQDTATGLLHFRWDFPAEDIGEIAGFRIYRSGKPSHEQEGFSIELMPSDTRDAALPPATILKSDMVFLDHMTYRWSRVQYMSLRVYGTPAASNPGLAPDFYNDETSGVKEWSYVPHPEPVPAALAAAGGQTCQSVYSSDSGSTTTVGAYFYAGTNQDYYFVFRGGETYTVDGWFRAGTDIPVPSAGINVTFTLNQHYGQAFKYPCVKENFTTIMPLHLHVTTDWQFFQTNFTIPVGCIIDYPTSVGRGEWAWASSGTLYMDNLRIYTAHSRFGGYLREDAAEMVTSGMRYIRTHQFCKTAFGYTMEGMTNPTGSNVQYGNYKRTVWTLSSVLRETHAVRMLPWLQLEMFLTEAEWLGFVEFMCATYDPSLDTQETKPWAYKRYTQGQALPWIDLFAKILLEISNETWNGLFSPWTFLGITMSDSVTQEEIGNGKLYGIFQERIIQIMKSSPYWSADAESKFEFVIGGWTAQTTSTGYGQQAIAMSPSSNIMTVAGYNGGWERGLVSDNSADGYIAAGVVNTQVLKEEAFALTEMQRDLAENEGLPFELGTYEAGPGYNMNGLNGASMSVEQTVAESEVMKSPVGAVATLDTFLHRASLGWKEQNFFTFTRNRLYWVSHAPVYKERQDGSGGGWAYPPWQALTLFNKYGTGYFLAVNTVTNPTLDAFGYSDLGLVAVYATKEVVNNSYTVFLLSKKLNYYPFSNSSGSTNVTLALPFYRAEVVDFARIYSTEGAMVSTLDSDMVPLEEQLGLNGSQFNLFPTFSVNLPPGSIYMYRFRNVRLWEAKSDNNRVQVQISAVRKVVAYTGGKSVQFRLSFDKSWPNFSLADVEVSGSALASIGGTVLELHSAWSASCSATLTVTDMRDAGTVTVTVISAVNNASATVIYTVKTQPPPVVDSTTLQLRAALAPPAAFPLSRGYNNSSGSISGSSSETEFLLTWGIKADIASYPQQAELSWGTSPNSRNRWSSGILSTHDPCPRCYVCENSDALFCSNASMRINTNWSFSTSSAVDQDVYQNIHPLFYSLSVRNNAGPSTKLNFTSFYVYEDFNSSFYIDGGRPNEWSCVGQGCTVDSGLNHVIERQPNSALKSPTGTAVIHIKHYYSSNFFYNSSKFFETMSEFQHYTMHASFSLGGSSGYVNFGLLMHYQDEGAYIRINIQPDTARMRIDGYYNTGSPVYGPFLYWTADEGEDGSSATAMDRGEYWQLSVSTEAIDPIWCGSALRLIISLRDQDGFCRIDYVTSSSFSQVADCAVKYDQCYWEGSKGTFGLYATQAKGGIAPEEVQGVYFDRIIVDSTKLY